MPNLIISTCGTSVFTNNCPQELRGMLTEIANKSQEEVEEFENKEQIYEWCRQREENLSTAGINDLKKLSAEINGLHAFYGENFDKDVALGDVHYLLCTDTWLGERAGTAIQNTLEARGFRTVKSEVPKDFKTSNVDEFHSGMLAAIDVIKGRLEAYPQHYKIFNLTGGFKSAAIFLSPLAMLYADKVISVFEAGGLLEIPRLPIEVEQTAKQEVAKNARTFWKLEIRGQVNAQECQGIRETFLSRLGNDRVLSAWGEVIWKEVKIELCNKGELLDTPDDRIVYGDQFLESIKNLRGDRMKHIYDCIETMVYHLENRNKSVLKSRKIEPVRGTNNQTYEMIAWSDADAKRIYFEYFDNNGIRCTRILKLGEHLR